MVYEIHLYIDVYRESTPFWELKKKDLFGSRRDTKKKRIVGTRDVCCSFGIDIYSNRIRKDAADSVYRCRGRTKQLAYIQTVFYLTAAALKKRPFPAEF